MQSIASLLVHKPLNILIPAVMFLAGFLTLRFTSLGQGKHATALLVPAVAWTIYAAWEWVVMTWTPEANIRVDLLLIWPVLLVLSVWFIIRALR